MNIHTLERGEEREREGKGGRERECEYRIFEDVRTASKTRWHRTTIPVPQEAEEGGSTVHCQLDMRPSQSSKKKGKETVHQWTACLIESCGSIL